MLMEYFQTKYPELGPEFDSVLFQAYSKVPTDPIQELHYYVPEKFSAQK